MAQHEFTSLAEGIKNAFIKNIKKNNNERSADLEHNPSRPRDDVSKDVNTTQGPIQDLSWTENGEMLLLDEYFELLTQQRVALVESYDSGPTYADNCAHHLCHTIPLL